MDKKMKIQINNFDEYKKFFHEPNQSKSTKNITFKSRNSSKGVN